MPRAAPFLAVLLLAQCSSPETPPPAPDRHEVLLHECFRGNGPACAQAAFAYDVGLEGPVDQPKADELYRLACRAGQLKVCVWLGERYQAGRGVPWSFRRAKTYYARACRQGEARGCLKLGLIYADETREDRDLPKATRLMTRACDGGELQACLFVARQLRRGDAADREKALAMYESVCEAGEQAGCEGIAWGVGYSARDGVRRGILILDTACSHGMAAACQWLAQRAWPIEWDFGDVRNNVLKGVRLFSLACKFGSYTDCRLLGRLYEGEQLGKPDYAKAVDFYFAGYSLEPDDLSLAAWSRAEQKRQETEAAHQEFPPDVPGNVATPELALKQFLAAFQSGDTGALESTASSSVLAGLRASTLGPQKELAFRGQLGLSGLRRVRHTLRPTDATLEVEGPSRFGPLKASVRMVIEGRQWKFDGFESFELPGLKRLRSIFRWLPLRTWRRLFSGFPPPVPRSELLLSLQAEGSLAELRRGCNAAEKYEHEDCFELRQLDAELLPVDPDPEREARRYASACEEEQMEACLNLANLQGAGGPRDVAKSVATYAKACDCGEAEGCYQLAVLYREGGSVELDPAKSAELLTVACAYGHREACEEHTMLLARAGRNPAPRPPRRRAPASEYALPLERARVLLAESCDSGSGWDCARLAGFYEDGTLGGDYDRAATLYDRAYELNRFPENRARAERARREAEDVVAGLPYGGAHLDQSLPPGGGELGATFLRYLHALEAQDLAALSTVVSDEVLVQIHAALDPAAELAKRARARLKAPSIEGGEASGRIAWLRVHGELNGRMRDGIVRMVLEGTRWRFSRIRYKKVPAVESNPTPAGP